MEKAGCRVACRETLEGLMFENHTSSQASLMKFLLQYLKCVRTLQLRFHLTGPTRSTVFVLLLKYFSAYMSGRCKSFFTYRRRDATFLRVTRLQHTHAHYSGMKMLQQSQYDYKNVILKTKKEKKKQGRIHSHQLRMGGQERKCAFSHISTRAHPRTNGPTDGRMDGRTDGRTKPLIELHVRN